MRARDRKIGKAVKHHPTGNDLGVIVEVVGKVAMLVQREGQEPRLATIYETRLA